MGQIPRSIERISSINKIFHFHTALRYVHSLYTEDNLGQHNAGLNTVNAKDRPIALVNNVFLVSYKNIHNYNV